MKEGRNGPAPISSNIDAQQLVVNIYSRPGGQGPVVNLPASQGAASGAYQAVRDRLKAIQSNLPAMPSLPSMPTLPPLRLPSLPTIPSIPERVKVPVRVQVQTQEVKMPPPPPLPTLPPFRVPNRVIVGQMELNRPQMPPMPTLPKVEVVYEDVKPIYRPGSVFPVLTPLPQVPITQVVKTA